MTTPKPLVLVALARKRNVKAVRGSDGFAVVDWSEHSLGGSVVAPPGQAGREDGRRHCFLRSAAEAAVAQGLARADGRPVPPFHASWDGSGANPFPVLRRLSAATPAALASVPASLGLHPFGPFVEGGVDRAIRGDLAPPVCLDPGTDLREYGSLDWRDDDDKPVRVSTNAGDWAGVPLEPLAGRVARWLRPAPVEDDDEVLVDPRLIRQVGRSGGLVDGQLADPTASAADHQVLYDAGDAAGFVLEEVRRLGPTAFADRYGVPPGTAKAIRRGRRPGPVTVRRVLQAGWERLPAARETERHCDLDGCDQPTPRPNARYCGPAHGDRAYRLRRASRVKKVRS